MIDAEAVQPLVTLEQRADSALRSLGRMGLWLVLSVLSLGVVYWLAPQMVKVSLYKLSLLPAATYVLYWIDRALNEKRPHEYFEEAAALRAKVVGDAMCDLSMQANELEHAGRDRLLRRTILISAGMIAVALGS